MSIDHLTHVDSCHSTIIFLWRKSCKYVRNSIFKFFNFAHTWLSMSDELRKSINNIYLKDKIHHFFKISYIIRYNYILRGMNGPTGLMRMIQLPQMETGKPVRLTESVVFAPHPSESKLILSMRVPDQLVREENIRLTSTLSE